MQVVKNREEGILWFFCPVEKLHIINDKHIDQLVKVDEVVDGIVAAMVNKLIDEFSKSF